MVYLPDEIINHIIMFRERHPLFMMMRHLIEYCYKRDIYPYKNLKCRKFCYDYSFQEWYFILIRLKRQLNKPVFRFTPEQL